MSPERQRIAIAEVCGWTNIKTTKMPGTLMPGQHVRVGELTGCPPDKNGKPVAQYDFSTGPFNVVAYHSSFYRETIPSYLTDLNAMHEVEKKLLGYNELPLNSNLNRYEDYLISVCGSINKAFHATAPQRAEAFLKTLDKWEN